VSVIAATGTSLLPSVVVLMCCVRHPLVLAAVRGHCWDSSQSCWGYQGELLLLLLLLVSN